MNLSEKVISDIITLMVIFTFTIILPTIIVFGFIYRIKIKELQSKVDNSEKIQFHEEMTSMQHRLVVLEKIITDKGYQVHEEISNLKSIKQRL